MSRHISSCLATPHHVHDCIRAHGRRPPPQPLPPPAHPAQVILLRGNHEDAALASAYGMLDEVERKYPCARTHTQREHTQTHTHCTPTPTHAPPHTSRMPVPLATSTSSSRANILTLPSWPYAPDLTPHELHTVESRIHAPHHACHTASADCPCARARDACQPTTRGYGRPSRDRSRPCRCVRSRRIRRSCTAAFQAMR